MWRISHTIKRFQARHRAVSYRLYWPISTLFDTGALEAELARAVAERDVCEGLMRPCVEENVRIADIQTEIAAMGAKRFGMGGFLKMLRKQDRLVAGFDEAMWYALVDKVVVEDGDSLGYIFKNGSKVTV